MAKQHSTALDNEGLAALAQRFEHWRSTRTGRRERIPASLWAQAVTQCQGVGLSRVAKVLRLSRSELKRRRDEATPSLVRSAPEAPGPVGFVEVQVPLPGPGMEVEVHRGDGARLSFRCPDSAPLTALLHAFLGD